MPRSTDQTSRGLGLLSAAVLDCLLGSLTLDHPVLADGPLVGSLGPSLVRPAMSQTGPGWLLSAVHDSRSDLALPGGRSAPDGPPSGSEDPESLRLTALVELARGGDVEAFGLLYDHYQPMVYRYLHYRTSSRVIAEDLTSETFFRALRGLGGFRWQGRDFGAWLTTIARNLLLDHAKSGRTRLERTTDDDRHFDSVAEGPEAEVLATITGELLRQAMGRLSSEQRECLVLRFMEGCSIAETAVVLGRSEGAVKQLQLRAVRNLAALMPDGMRDA